MNEYDILYYFYKYYNFHHYNGYMNYKNIILNTIIKPKPNNKLYFFILYYNIFINII